MSQEIAIITGISGQDGSYLSELLLQNEIKVIGVSRNKEHRNLRNIIDQIEIYNFDVCDEKRMQDLLKKYQPNYFFNLAAQSHVQKSCKYVMQTMQTNINSVINVCELIRVFCPCCKMYQAGSSEMFGDSVDADGFQREKTYMNPLTPYAISKFSAYKVCQFYRTNYNMFIANGILFNHESPRRSEDFLTTKVVKGILDIKYRKKNNLYLGNLDISRDWGHSKDYVKSMYLMLQQNYADDFVISTMKTHTVEYLVKYVCHKLNVGFEVVIQEDNLKRKLDQKKGLGDSTKARKQLGWQPEYTFEQMLDEIIDYHSKNHTVI